jgi:dTDP-glucose 4,6-dehydratase
VATDDLTGARVVVTGGAGFLGSHLVDRLVAAGAHVLVLDNLRTGRRANLAHLLDHPDRTGRTERPAVRLREHDVTEHIEVGGPVDHVLHLASPASPVDYLQLPIQTLKVGSLGTHNALGLAMAKGARFLLTSTSEVYGDPAVHPQPETYWGNVNPVGPRGVYDEAKRFAEALTLAYHRTHGVDTRIARIFNTYGPRMRIDDGRLVPSFLSAAAAGEPLTVHGDGSQTRTLCYVDDLVDGLMALLLAPASATDVSGDVHDPVNLGGEQEVSVTEFAQRLLAISDSSSELVHVDRPVDDPERRRPDLARARALLGWSPRTDLEDGLQRTLDYRSR